MTSKSEAKRLAVVRRPAPEPIGPIIDIRYVRLVDGRSIMQIARSPGVWQTAASLPVQSLTDAERAEITDVLSSYRNDPNAR